MKNLVLGIVLIFAGAAMIVAGIVVKRQFDMPQALIAFHTLGGLLLLSGLISIISGLKDKEQQ